MNIFKNFLRKSLILYIRPEIVNFAFQMEEEMQIKDKLNYTYKDKTLEYLYCKLKEERKEVDNEINDLPSLEINKELIHEAIMTMLIKIKINEEK